MDFGELLYAAQRNEHQAKAESVKCYRTTFDPPKKEQKNKTLSNNIQKFLARKEGEEKRKAEEARKKREELVALRSQDGMARKRVQAMLKRTKAANKSVIDDAIDEDNTAVTLGGPCQPDEDDYGYVSQEASALFNKLMDKYKSAPPEEPLFPDRSSKPIAKDLSSTKDRVRAALEKQKEEEMMPHKRKRKSKKKETEDDGDTTINYSTSDMRDLDDGHKRSNRGDDYSEEEEEKAPRKPVKPKRPAPPPMDFHELLKLAEKKQFEPIKVEPRVKEEEDERPMTKKQKLEHMKEQEWRRRKEESSRNGGHGVPSQRTSKTSEDGREERRPDSGQRIPKLNNKDDRQSDAGNRIPKINRDERSIDASQRIPKFSSRDGKQNDTSQRIPKVSDRDETRNDYLPQSNNRSRDERSNDIDRKIPKEERYRDSGPRLGNKRENSPSDDRYVENRQKSYKGDSNRYDKQSNPVQRIPKLNNREERDYNSGMKTQRNQNSRDEGQRPMSQPKYPKGNDGRREDNSNRIPRPNDSRDDRTSSQQRNSNRDGQQERKLSKPNGMRSLDERDNRSDYRRDDYQEQRMQKQNGMMKRDDRDNRSDYRRDDQQERMMPNRDDRMSKHDSDRDNRSDYNRDNQQERRMPNRNDRAQYDSDSGDGRSDYRRDNQQERRMPNRNDRTQYDSGRDVHSDYKRDSHQDRKMPNQNGMRNRNDRLQYDSDRDNRTDYKRDNDQERKMPKQNGMNRNDRSQHDSDRDNRMDYKRDNQQERKIPKQSGMTNRDDRMSKYDSDSKDSRSGYRRDNRQEQKVPKQNGMMNRNDRSKYDSDSRDSRSDNNRDNQQERKMSKQNGMVSRDDRISKQGSDNRDYDTPRKNESNDKSRLLQKKDFKSNSCDNMRTSTQKLVDNRDSKYQSQNLKSSNTSSKPGNPNRNVGEDERRNNNTHSGKPQLSGYSKKLQDSLVAKLQERKEAAERNKKQDDKGFKSRSEPNLEPKSSVKPGSKDPPMLKKTEGMKRPAGNEPVRKDSIGKDLNRTNLVGQRSVSGGGLPSRNPNPSKPAINQRPQPGVQIDRTKTPASSTNVKPKQFPPSDMKPRQFPPADVKPRQFPPPDVRSRQFPPADVRRKQFPPGDVRKRPQPPVKRRIEDSDEEYDSEMSDFIDDGPEEEEDISQHIRAIFGYDKRRYEGFEDDDECMESSFAQQLKEEFVSTKLGILEDLEDIQKEQEEKKRKAKMMKKKKKL